MAKVNVLGHRALTQVGTFEALGQLMVTAMGHLAVYQQTQAFLKAHHLGVGQTLLLLPGGCHAGQFEGEQFVVGGMVKHKQSAVSFSELLVRSGFLVRSGLFLRVLLRRLCVCPASCGHQAGHPFGNRSRPECWRVAQVVLTMRYHRKR